MGGRYRRLRPRASPSRAIRRPGKIGRTGDADFAARGDDRAQGRA
jgi:hypothetical protein